MRIWALAIGLSAATFAVGSSSVSAENLREAVATAVANNPRIEEATANRRAVDEELNQARGLFLPRLDLEATAGYYYNHQPKDGTVNDNRWGDTATLVGRQTLFDGGFRWAEVDKQVARVGGAAERVRERSELVAIETIRAYLDIVRFTEIERLAAANITEHRKYVALAETRFRGGSSTQGEVDLAKERLYAAESTLEDVKRTLGLARARYLNLVGRSAGYLAPATYPSSIPRSRDAVRNRARALNPTLLAAARDVEAAEAELAQAGAAFRPRVDLETRASAGHDQGGTAGPDHDASARFVMNWNLYDGRIKDARERERAERLAEVMARQDRLRRAVDEAVDRAWTDMVRADARLRVLDRQVNAGKALVASYRQEFDSGLRSLLDLMQAIGTRFNSQVQQRTTQALTILARYELLSSMGGLLHHFRLSSGPDGNPEVRPWNRSSHHGWRTTVHK